MFWIIFSLCGGFIGVAAILAHLWENRPVWAYIQPEPGEEFQLSPRAEDANADALAKGYRNLGAFHDGKGRLFSVRYDFWISADAMIFAVVGSGRVALIPVFGVWFYTRLRAGQFLISTNEPGHSDISGVSFSEVWNGADFNTLHAHHADMLGPAGSELEPFPASDPIAGFRQYKQQAAETLVERGRAYFVDDERSIWRYTMKGAILSYVKIRFRRAPTRA
jgi:hypothetical protein